MGGTDVVLAEAGELPGYLSMTQTYVDGAATEYGAIKIASMLAWGLGYFGMPHVLLRFMAIRDENEVKISRRIATVWVVISMSVAIFIDLIGHSMTANGVIDTLYGADSEN